MTELNTRLLQRQLARWYPLIPHPVQLRLVSAVERGVRFPVVPAGRRSGKTERAKRFLVKWAMKHEESLLFAAAPTYNQAKKIWWEDLKSLALTASFKRQPSESDLKIYFPNGSEIHVIGLDKPQRIEGIPWTGGVIDEIADVKGEAVDLNIMPALNTVNPTRPDYRAWCWFIGVPEGLNHYYDMAEYARTSDDPEWEYFHWVSEDILPPDIIEAAKRTMSERDYNQEYRASFVTAKGKIYDNYSDSNITNATIEPHEELHWTHDQNFTPLSSAIAVVREGVPYFLDEIVLESAVAYESAEEFITRYKDHKNKRVYLYGDPAGRVGEKHGHKSDYQVIEEILKKNGWQYIRRVKPAAPAIRDRQNAVRAMIRNAMGESRLFVNKNSALYCHKGLATVQLKEGSTYQEDQKNEYQHITTAIGYFVDYLWPKGALGVRTNTVTGNY